MIGVLKKRLSVKKKIDWKLDIVGDGSEKENLETLKAAGVKVQELKDSSSFDTIAQKVADSYTAKSATIQSLLEEAQK